MGARPLRGDEAFAVRYWAQPLAFTLEPRDGLAWREPHPLGVFFAFFTWKSLAGDSEFAMRALPALVNLLGVPAMYGLARQLFRAPRFGLAGALLWALNPNLIWHSQDARDYAMWAAFSAVTLWLFVRLCRKEVRRADAALYVVASIVAFYTFFLEVFFVIVHGLYLVFLRRDRLRLWLGQMLIVALALLPWAGQAIALARSGYQGALTGTADDTPWRLLGALLYGETLPGITEGSSAQPFFALALAGVFLVVFGWMAREHRRAGALVALALAMPFVLLALAATRLDVFGPRYLMGATPALLLPWAFALARTWEELREPRRARLVRFALVALVVAALVVPGGISLARYVSADYHKAPDWFALRDYMRAVVRAGDGLIVSAVDARTGAIDPAFEYYYRGSAPFLVLPYPGADVNALVARELESRRAVWFVVGGTSGKVDEQLRAQGVLVSDDGAGRSFLVRQYRAHSVKPAEIEAALELSVGELNLQGYAITGPRHSGAGLSVLLFWGGTPPAGLSTFVHLIGPARPDGSPIWAQDDHPPAAPGRDVYRLDLRGVPPGDYHIEIGLYDANTGQRASLLGQSGAPAGESVVLEIVKVRE